MYFMCFLSLPLQPCLNLSLSPLLGTSIVQRTDTDTEKTVPTDTAFNGRFVYGFNGRYGVSILVYGEAPKIHNEFTRVYRAHLYFRVPTDGYVTRYSSNGRARALSNGRAPGEPLDRSLSD